MLTPGPACVGLSLVLQAPLCSFITQGLATLVMSLVSKILQPFYNCDSHFSKCKKRKKGERRGAKSGILMESELNDKPIWGFLLLSFRPYFHSGIGWSLFTAYGGAGSVLLYSPCQQVFLQLLQRGRGDMSLPCS